MSNPTFNLYNLFKLDFESTEGFSDKNKPKEGYVEIIPFPTKVQGEPAPPPLKNPLLLSQSLESILDSSFPFFGEAMVVGKSMGYSQRVLFFNSMDLEKGIITPPNDIGIGNNSFRIGTIMLPPTFRYVTYKQGQQGTIEGISKGNVREKNVFAPILLYFPENSSGEGSSANNIDLFHICQSPILEVGTEACHFDCKSMIGQSFHLFFYSGELVLPESTTPKKGNFYLIPFVLSEGLVTYYALEEQIDGSHKVFFNYLLENQGNIRYIEVPKPITYNDHLGVFIFTDIKFVY